MISIPDSSRGPLRRSPWRNRTSACTMSRIAAFALLAGPGGARDPSLRLGAEGVRFRPSTPRLLRQLVRLRGTGPARDVFLVQRSPPVGPSSLNRAGTDGAFVFELRQESRASYQARTLAAIQRALDDRAPAPPVPTQGLDRHRKAASGPIGKVFSEQGAHAADPRGSAGRFRARVRTASEGGMCGRLSVNPHLVSPRCAALRSDDQATALRLVLTVRWCPRAEAAPSQLGYALPSIDSGYRYGTTRPSSPSEGSRPPPDGPRRPSLLAVSPLPRPAGTSPPRRLHRGEQASPTLYEFGREGRPSRARVDGETGTRRSAPGGLPQSSAGMGLYHPMYFLRGFAIHGYPSVPAWPASHGCVRIPLWLASGLVNAGATARSSASTPEADRASRQCSTSSRVCSRASHSVSLGVFRSSLP